MARSTAAQQPEPAICKQVLAPYKRGITRSNLSPASHDGKDQPGWMGGRRCLDIHKGRSASFNEKTELEICECAIGSFISLWARTECVPRVASRQWITCWAIEAIDETEIRARLICCLHDHRRSVRDLYDHDHAKALPRRQRCEPGVRYTAPGQVGKPTPAVKQQRSDLQAPGTPTPYQLAPIRKLASEKHGAGSGGRRGRRRCGSDRRTWWPSSTTANTGDDQCRNPCTHRDHGSYHQSAT
jgi:hypothetical protein